jgi:hypothetical protein
MKTTEEKLKIAIDALMQCTNPSGAYSLDRLEHAENTIKNIEIIAKTALKELNIILDPKIFKINQ